MRIRDILLIAMLGAAGLAVGCGANEVEMGDGGNIPTPTPTPSGTASPTVTPNPAQFTTVQTFLEDNAKANCGKAGCHVPPAGTAGIALYTAPGTAQGDVAKNAVTFACSPNLDAYNPVTGLIYDTFCAPGGTANTAPQHDGRTNLVNADCAALKTYLETGSGPVAACP